MILQVSRTAADVRTDGQFLVDSTVGRDTLLGVFVQDDEDHKIRCVCVFGCDCVYSCFCVRFSVCVNMCMFEYCASSFYICVCVWLCFIVCASLCFIFVFCDWVSNCVFVSMLVFVLCLCLVCDFNCDCVVSCRYV